MCWAATLHYYMLSTDIVIIYCKCLARWSLLSNKKRIMQRPQVYCWFMMHNQQTYFILILHTMIYPPYIYKHNLYVYVHYNVINTNLYHT